MTRAERRSSLGIVMTAETKAARIRLSDDPRVEQVDDFLAPAERDAMIAAALPQPLERPPGSSVQAFNSSVRQDSGMDVESAWHVPLAEAVD